jgi:hypothetical protein
MSAEDVEKLAKDILAQNLSDDVIYEKLGRLDAGDNALGERVTKLQNL